jgi:glucosamine 6-phosphate synthetase-like amidotransferase/phosphosugar isomerase protein
MAKFSRLDEIVIETLRFFRNQENLSSLDVSGYASPLVVGSGNGYYTGRILFRNVGAYFASESEVEEKLKNISHITDVVVVSASGEKHAPIIVELAKKYKKKTLLISSSQKSTAKSLADASIIMPKIREPYTYNTSTYFGYMLAENPELDLAELEKFLRETLSPLAQKAQFEKYTSFCIVLPNQFVLLREMIETKFIELFGRKVARDVFTYE